MTERSAIRDRAVRAMIPIAAAEGWNCGTIRAGLRAIGEDPALAESHFPAGPVGAVLAWIDLLNREMEAAAAAEGVTALRVPQRIRRVVELRLQGHDSEEIAAAAGCSGRTVRRILLDVVARALEDHRLVVGEELLPPLAFRLPERDVLRRPDQ